jgi:hypothetical protein
MNLVLAIWSYSIFWIQNIIHLAQTGTIDPLQTKNKLA